jgi:hypothetical protein
LKPKPELFYFYMMLLACGSGSDPLFDLNSEKIDVSVRFFAKYLLFNMIVG